MGNSLKEDQGAAPAKRSGGSIKGFANGDPRNARIAAKRQTILDAARAMFLRDGYAATTLEAVAAGAGVSKMTLYRHFGSKEVLFEALVRGMAEGIDELEGLEAQSGDAHARLRAFGVAFARSLMRPEALALYRMIVSEAERFPDLARLFQDRGRAQAQGWVAALLREERGLDCDEAATRARDFDAMVLGDLFQRRLLGLETESSAEQIAEQVERACEFALR